MKFGDKLSQLRRKNGLSQEELGEKLNVTRQTISKWELGQSKPDTDKLMEISKLLNVYFNQLIDDESTIEDNISKTIEKEFYKENSEHGLVILLNGEWGTGKTTFINQFVGMINSQDDIELFNNYNAYETNGTFNVVKQDVIVTFNPIEDVAYGSNVTITGTFTDVNGKSIGNSNVKIIINGKKYYARTDSSGAFTFTAKTIDMGINDVSIGYSGNENYNSYETTTTFNVGKQDVIVTYNPIDPVASGENVTITGKFTNAEGKAIISSNVKIVINGQEPNRRIKE